MPATTGRSRTSTRVLERSADGGSVSQSDLPGGLRVITETMPAARSASIGVWVGVGAVDEQPRLAGASHFLEHLLFKGTTNRTGREIAVAIDGIGGDFNAFTAHEYTCYYLHVLASEAQLAVEMVSDVVLNATIPAPDVDIERQVILEEIAMRDDNPEDVLSDAFCAAVFAGLPIARPVIGSEASIGQLSRTQIAGYYRRRYRPPAMVVSVAGGVDHADVVRWVKRAFAAALPDLPAPSANRPSSNGSRLKSAVHVVHRDTEQAHLCLGTRGFSRTDPRRHAMAVLSTAVGGGMSSRLFRAIREDRGLVYSVYSAVAAYRTTGSFSVYLGCSPENLAEATEILGKELVEVRGGLDTQELAIAKSQLIGSTILGLEDSESRMTRNGKDVLVRGGFRPLQAELDAISAVTAADVAAVADQVFGQPLTAGLVGPYSDTADTPPVLRDLVDAGIGR